MTITEFLLARIAEDEESNNPKPDSSGSCDYLSGVHYESARVLAECAAKRAIIATQSVSRIAAVPSPFILRALATVYADHPDYQQEWAL